LRSEGKEVCSVTEPGTADSQDLITDLTVQAAFRNVPTRPCRAGRAGPPPGAAASPPHQDMPCIPSAPRTRQIFARAGAVMLPIRYDPFAACHALACACPRGGAILSFVTPWHRSVQIAALGVSGPAKGPAPRSHPSPCARSREGWSLRYSEEIRGHATDMKCERASTLVPQDP
jgi:hypothetical protein